MDAGPLKFLSRQAGIGHQAAQMRGHKQANDLLGTLLNQALIGPEDFLSRRGRRLGQSSPLGQTGINQLWSKVPSSQ
jgi:hypothetical protein